jgi:Skp1 family, tetramerisation domain
MSTSSPATVKFQSKDGNKHEVERKVAEMLGIVSNFDCALFFIVCSLTSFFHVLMVLSYF